MYSFFNKWLIILSVIALLAEHSFWFSGRNIQEQISYAVKSFKSQKHISIVMREVEATLTNAIAKEDPAWLIQWAIDNKIVCNII